jgi:hypothetical protein
MPKLKKTETAYFQCVIGQLHQTLKSAAKQARP